MSSPAPDNVGRALSALADADVDTGDRPESRPPAAVIVEVRDALQSLLTVACSPSDGGELTLR